MPRDGGPGADGHRRVEASRPGQHPHRLGLRAEAAGRPARRPCRHHQRDAAAGRPAHGGGGAGGDGDRSRLRRGEPRGMRLAQRADRRAGGQGQRRPGGGLRAAERPGGDGRFPARGRPRDAAVVRGAARPRHALRGGAGGRHRSGPLLPGGGAGGVFPRTVDRLGRLPGALHLCLRRHPGDLPGLGGVGGRRGAARPGRLVGRAPRAGGRRDAAGATPSATSPTGCRHRRRATSPLAGKRSSRPS